MKDLLILTVHLLTTIAKLLRLGGARAIVADSLITEQQLLIINRTRKRCHIQRAAIIIRPSTLLRFHQLVKQRKYRRLYSSCATGKPSPKAPSKELINAIVDMKQRNPNFGCPRATDQSCIGHQHQQGCCQANSGSTLPDGYR